MNNLIFAGKHGLPNQTEEHSHKCWEILYALADGEMHAEGEVIPFRRGEGVVVPPLVRHSVTITTTHAKVVHIEQALLPFKKITVLKDDKNEGLHLAITQAISYFERRSGSEQAVLCALGDLIVAYAVAFSGVGKYSPVVERVMDEIEKHLSDSSFALDDYLHSLPLNYDYIRKLFKSEVGTTPHDHLVGSRMKRAADILRSGISNSFSNYSISQVAESCGYAEPLYFSRVFKKYYGVSPSAFSSQQK